jgi:hypothetical protein
LKATGLARHGDDSQGSLAIPGFGHGFLQLLYRQLGDFQHFSPSYTNRSDAELVQLLAPSGYHNRPSPVNAAATTFRRQ